MPTLSSYLFIKSPLLIWPLIIGTHHSYAQQPSVSPVEIAVSGNILKDAKHFAKGQDFADIEDFSGKGARRDVTSLILLEKALKLGGLNEPVSYRTDSEYKRLISRVRNGEFTLMAEPVWLNHVASDKSLLASDAIIRSGEFTAGLYTSPNHWLSRVDTLPEPYNQFTATTSPHWHEDVEILESLGIDKIHYSLYWKNMVKIVFAQRADFTLAAFQNTPDLSISAYGVRLVPIKNVKVAFAGGRHFIVSRRHPRGKEVFNFLQSGLKQLRAAGTITRAYRESGFFNAKVKDWPTLNITSEQLNSPSPTQSKTQASPTHSKTQASPTHSNNINPLNPAR